VADMVVADMVCGRYRHNSMARYRGNEMKIAKEKIGDWREEMKELGKERLRNNETLRILSKDRRALPVCL